MNKCCPKDDFPLARIDKSVNSVAGYEIMFLLDWFSGYHQIWLRREDEEKKFYNTIWHILLPENVGEATQCRPHFL
jgi:hypothetical protein